MSIEYNTIEDISNIKNVYYVTDCSRNNEELINHFRNELSISIKFINNMADISSNILQSRPDLFLIDQKFEFDSNAGIRICNYLRGNGYKGIVILCINDPVSEVSNSLITSIGFDNFMPLKCNLKIFYSQLHWAILNRRRKNKNILQFDNNPDALYTVGKDGTIYDINETATLNCPYGPKGIVINRINIMEVGTLPTFDEIIKPLISNNNVDKTFEHTSNEDSSVYQIKVNISNLPVIGLVATVFKTDITHVIFTRTLDILTNSIALLSHRDNYTAGHSSRVFYYCLNIVNSMNSAEHTIDKKFSKNLFCASLLHDIGKIGVKDRILLKPGKLDEHEFKELYSHPIKGCNMLKRYKFLEDSIAFIKSHHERPDGKGYPERLRGKDIPTGAAIIAVADSFDAMTSNRPYRDSLQYDRAVKEVEQFAGEQFDYDIAHAFLKVISPDLMQNIKNASCKPLESIAKEIIDLCQADN